MIDLTMSLKAEMVNLSCNSIAILFDNIADAFSDNPSPSEAEVTLSGGLRGGLTKTTKHILPGGLREKGGSPSQDEATCC